MCVIMADYTNRINRIESRYNPDSLNEVRTKYYFISIWYRQEYCKICKARNERG